MKKIYKKFFTAVMNNDVEAVKSLLASEKIDVNVKNDRNQLALHLAAFNNYTDVMRHLLSCKNIDVNAKDRTERTALMQTITLGAVEAAIVKMLLDHEDVKVSVDDEVDHIPLRAYLEMADMLKAKMQS